MAVVDVVAGWLGGEVVDRLTRIASDGAQKMALMRWS